MRTGRTKVPAETVEIEAGEETSALLGDPNWYPGVWNQLPWLGVIGFAFVFIGILIAIVILVVSDGKKMKDWPIQSFTVAPNVLINLANQLSSFGLVTAVGQGLAIVWWRKALHGSTLKTLYRDYNYGISFFAILTSGKRFNIIALATLVTKFGIIDSTLFQRATTTTLRYSSNYDTANTQAWYTKQWPQGQGGIPGDDGDIDTFDRSFADIITAFNTKRGNNKLHDTTILFNGCPPAQACSGTLDALGFGYDCSMTIENVDYGVMLQDGSIPSSGFAPLWSVSFQPDWADDTKPYASVNLTMFYINSYQGPNRTCPGTLTRRTCSIRPALVRYPLLIQAADPSQSINVTHLGFEVIPEQDHPFNADIPWEQIDSIEVLNYTDLSEKFREKSTVGAIAFALNNLFKSNASLYVIPDGEWDLNVSGAQAQAQFWANDTNQISKYCAYELNVTGEGQPDPFVGLLRDINSFGFVSALYIGRAPKVAVGLRQQAGLESHNFTTRISGYNQQYKTNFGYLAGAIATSLLSVLCVLPVYWGYWQLGRRVTLEAFEIGQALGAPLLTGVAIGTGYVEELLEKAGDVKVQYGKLLDGETGQLRIAEPNRVVAPHADIDPSILEEQRRTRTVRPPGVIGIGVAGATAGIALSNISVP